MKREKQKIILVTGKGGVGKTAVASGLALAHAKLGRKVLLAELGERSFLRHIFGHFPGQGTHLVTENLWVTRWDGESCLREYLLHYLRLEKMVDLFFSNTVMRALLGAAPALKELAIIGKITSGPRGVGPDLPYDVIVVDAYATGHFQALLRAPVGMAKAIPLGPMGEQSRNITQVIRDPLLTQVVVVTLPEELPVAETKELHHFLKNEEGVQPVVICNRNWPIPLSAEEMLEATEKMQALRPPPEHLLAFAKHLTAAGERQDWAHQELRGLGGRLLSLPHYLMVDWLQIVRQVAADLGELCRTG